MNFSLETKKILGVAALGVGENRCAVQRSGARQDSSWSQLNLCFRFGWRRGHWPGPADRDLRARALSGVQTRHRPRITSAQGRANDRRQETREFIQPSNPLWPKPACFPETQRKQTQIFRRYVTAAAFTPSVLVTCSRRVQDKLTVVVHNNSKITTDGGTSLTYISQCSNQVFWNCRTSRCRIGGWCVTAACTRWTIRTNARSSVYTRGRSSSSTTPSWYVIGCDFSPGISSG